jgi:hypothetical protein
MNLKLAAMPSVYGRFGACEGVRLFLSELGTKELSVARKELSTFPSARLDKLRLGQMIRLVEKPRTLTSIRCPNATSNLHSLPSLRS